MTEQATSTESLRDVKFEIGHVLFIDIVGYSKLLITEQSEQIRKLKEIVRGTEQFRLAKAEGKLLGLPTGDGGALVFRSNSEAPVLCAIEISRALKSEPSLQIRMGIHSGPVNEISDLNAEANIAGAGINIAQRVMDCGDAGHILISKHVAEDLEQYPGWRPLLHELGDCEVKHGVRIGVTNLYSDDFGNAQLPKKFQVAKKHRAHVRWAEIITALLVLAAVVTAFVFLLRKPARWSSAIVEKSIAVLPFTNLSPDPGNAYFADGVQDEILTRLSKIADLKVISRTSTQRYKSAPGNLREIASQLGVAHILEGSVQKSGDVVRVNVQLIRAANDSHLWADTFDRKLTDLFSVESEVARSIAEKLRAELAGREEQAIAAKPTSNTEAHDAYLRGLAYTLKPGGLTTANSIAAQKYLKEAVRLDPTFALAWALLSMVDANGYNSRTLQATAELKEEAWQAAETALALQPSLGEALLAKGTYYSILDEYENAKLYFERAREVLPNSSLIPEHLAYVARSQGRWDESESYFTEAERLDPRNASLLTQRALSYIFHRRFPEALRQLDRILDITPDNVDTVGLKALVAEAQGDLEGASTILDPLSLGADDSFDLETQIYLAILKRQPEKIIPRLNEILSKPDPTIGFYNGELRFWLGWAQQVAGHNADAKITWQKARAELEGFLREQPENDVLIGDLALVAAGLNDKSNAVALAKRAMTISPIEKNALDGGSIELLARVYAQIGEPDRAVAILNRLLSMPYQNYVVGIPITPALLRLDPMFDSLRSDPRFGKLAHSDGK